MKHHLELRKINYKNNIDKWTYISNLLSKEIKNENN